MEIVASYSDINAKFENNSKSVLLLYKSGHRESECAYHNLEMALQNKSSISAFTADVNTVLDIHSHYGVVNIPSVLVFNNGDFKEVVKGCQSDKDYLNLVDTVFKKEKTTLSSKKTTEVTVYSTPTCGWCTSVKRWLQENRVGYKDIDISIDDIAAQKLIKRSGHSGVPQIEINDEIVVGFQLPRLKELLKIK